MKIAVSAHGEALDARVDDRFGRTAFLLIVSDDGSLLEVVDNRENRDALQGAGIGAAELVAEHGATAVLTGHLGPKAFEALRAAGISGYSATGLTVSEAVTRYGQGALKPLDQAAPAHGGM